MKPKKIIYISGTRADYGLMRAILQKLHTAPEFDLSLCVTGMHLSSLYGNTIDEIKQDNFKIAGLIPVDVDQSTQETMALSIGYEIIGFTEVLAREKPDLLLLLGDRGETLAAAIVAVHLNIPIVHLHGGERSGTVDEMVRHAISKLSHYHFVATEASKERLIRMGEKEESIFVIGAPGLDALAEHKTPNSKAFLQQYHFTPDKKIGLLVYHPVVQEYEELASQFENALKAALAARLQIICLEPNSDAGGHFIRKVLQAYQHHPDVRIVTHLVRPDFIDCLAEVDIMLGNSSAGIIEAASFNLVVVNIGTRQNLRERSSNVIDVSPSFDAISLGIKQALSCEKATYTNCYGDGKSSERCYQLLKTIQLDETILNKSNAY